MSEHPAVLERVVLTVTDLEESEAFYSSGFAMARRGEPRIDPARRARYGLAVGPPARCLTLAAPYSRTELELIEFKGAPRTPRRARDRTASSGLLSLAFRVRDQAELYARLRAEGHAFVSEPVSFSATFAGGRRVKDVELWDPNGAMLSLIEYVDESAPADNDEVLDLIDTGLWVPDMDAAIAMFRDVLGLSLVERQLVPAGLLDELLALPEGARVEIAFLTGAANRPVIELLSCKPEVGALPDAPDRPGLTALVFRIRDCAARRRAARACGAEHLASDAAAGAVMKLPNGALLELLDADAP